MGAGNGYWASLLKEAGADILAFDYAPPRTQKNFWFKKTNEFGEVKFGQSRLLRKYPDRTLFLCWPPMSEMASQCLENWKGKHLIYIGESCGGCTANDDFFEQLERDFEEIESLDIPQWPGIHDTLTIHQRK